MIRTLANALKIVSIVLLALMVAGGSVWFFDYWIDKEQPREVGRSVVFNVTEDDDTSTVADRLQDADLISQPWYFENKMRFSSVELRPGTYNLQIGMTTNQIIQTITVEASSSDEETTTAGPERPAFAVTFIEGQRMEQNAEVLDAQWPGAGAEYLTLARDIEYWRDAYEFLKDVPAGGTLEGFLFPDTYTVPSNGTVTALIDYQLQNFQDHLTDDILAGFTAQGLNIFEAVIVASIVEREAAVSIERPSIAEVYLNRVHDDMNMNADPSQQYGIGTAENWWPRLTENDNLARSKETAWDTYMAANIGLPPGPIANPGSASLQAVSQPANDGYYYFVAKGDCSGEHRFTFTYDEHQVAVEEEDSSGC